MSSKNAKKQVGGLLSYLYPKKEDIQSQLMDIMPEINTTNISNVTEKIKILSKNVANGTTTWQKLFDTLPLGQKHLAQLGQQMEGQIITTKSVAKANQQARETAIAHNNALKQQTLGAKATKVAMSALATAGNMLLVMAISKGVEWLINYNQRLEESRQEIIETGKEAAQLTTDLDCLVEQYRKLGKDGKLDTSDKEQAYNIQQQINELLGEEVTSINLANGEYEEQLELLKKLQYEKANENHAKIKDAKNAAGDSLKNATKKGWNLIGGGNVVVQSEQDAIKSLLEETNMDNYLKNDSVRGFSFEIDTSSSDATIQSYEDMIKLRSILSRTYETEIEKGGVLEDFYGELVNKIDNMSDAVQKYKDAMNDYNINEAIIQFNETEFDGIKGALIDSEEGMSKWITAMIESKDVTDGVQSEIIALAKTWYPQYTSQINNAAEAESKKIIQDTLANKSNSLNIESLKNAASTLGITEVAMMELLLAEIRFNKNGLNVSQKVSALKELAVWAGVAETKMDSIFSANSKSKMADKEEWAKQNGVTINYHADKDGTHTYTYNGKTYSGVNAVNEVLADEAIQQQIDKIGQVKTTPTTTAPTSTTPSSEAQSFKESFNWIETALSRIQQKVTHFGKTVAATWQSWKVRNAALKDQMSAIRNEISLQDQAYTKYTNLANSVGLSEGYKTLVREGSINIETIESESIAEAIKLYQEYYEKALAARDASADLKDELAALAQTKFSNLAQSFADLMSGNEHTISMYEATIELMEKRGYTASASLYDSLKQAELDNQGILKEKYQSLSQALDEAVNSGAVVKYSEQWYQMQNEILAVEEAIIQSNIALAEYDNALRDLEWNAFDRLHEEISEIYEETEFLDKLLSDEKKFNEDGSMTEAGQASLGLGVVNYKTHLAQADEYAQELERIRKDLAKDPYNQDLIDRQDELEEKHREVLTQIEDDEQSMIDTVSEGYDTLLDHMDNMIDKRKNMLSQAKDLYEYEKNISKQTQEIASLEKQLAAYQGDDSEEARATIQKLQVSLSEAKDNLEETEYEKYISDQEEMLDTLRLQTEEWINARLDNEDQLLKDIVSSTEQNAAMINDTLTEVASSTGTTLSDAMKTIWSNDGDIGKAIGEIKTYLAGMQKNAEEKAKEQVQNNTPASSGSSTAPASEPTSSAPATTSAPKWGDFFIKKSDSYPKEKLNRETSIVDRLKYSNFDSSFSARSQYYTAMGGSGVYTGSSAQNSWMISQMKANGYARGGFIGNMIRAAGEDGIALVRRGEGIIPTNMVPEWNALIHHLPQLNNSMLDSIPQHETNVSIDIGDIQMYGVNDPETFAHQLKQAMLNNNSIRNIMKDTTIGEAIGRNSMIRYTR